jgi:anti-sigma factor RsiW
VTCRDVIEFLMDYLSGELKPGEVALFELHMSQCPPCIAFLRTYQQAVALGQAACGCHEEPVPEELIQAILAVRPDSGPPASS